MYNDETSFSDLGESYSNPLKLKEDKKIDI